MAAGTWCGPHATRPLHADAVRRAGPGRQPPPDADRGRPDRAHRAGHAEQLRQQPDALGHLPRARRTGWATSAMATGRTPTPSALGRAPGQRLWLGQVRRALRRREEPQQPIASAGWSRSIHGPDQHAGEAHRARSRAHEGAWVASRATAAPSSTRRGRASNTSTASSAATASRPAPGRHHPSCSTTARCRWRASTPTAAAAGCRWCTARGR